MQPGRSGLSGKCLRLLLKLGALPSLVLVLLAASACGGPVCPEGSVTYLTDPADFPALVSPAPAALTPVVVEIGGRQVEVERVVTGPVCNEAWSGTIYVACNLQVAEWEKGEAPQFFENCDLTIDPDTVIYVAAHNDAVYYKGCSCHTGGEPD